MQNVPIKVIIMWDVGMMNGLGSAWALSGQCARVYTPRALMSFYYKSPYNPRPLLIAAVTAKNMPHQYLVPKTNPLNKLPWWLKPIYASALSTAKLISHTWATITCKIWFWVNLKRASQAFLHNSYLRRIINRRSAKLSFWMQMYQSSIDC